MAASPTKARSAAPARGADETRATSARDNKASPTMRVPAYTTGWNGGNESIQATLSPLPSRRFRKPFGDWFG